MWFTALTVWIPNSHVYLEILAPYSSVKHTKAVKDVAFLHVYVLLVQGVLDTLLVLSTRWLIFVMLLDNKH